MKIKIHLLAAASLIALGIGFFAFNHSVLAACAEYDFTAVQNGPLPTQPTNCGGNSTISATNGTPTGGETMIWTTSFSNNVPTGSNPAGWLTFQNCHGWSGCGSGGVMTPGYTDTITFLPKTTALPPNTYSTLVTITTGTCSTTGTTCNQSQSASNGTANVTVKYVVSRPPCTITSFNSNPASPIDYGTNTTLQWATSNVGGTGSDCDTATLSGGQFGAGTGQAVNGSAVTSNLVTSTTYTLQACQNGGNCTTSNYTVTVNQPCTINVASQYNGNRGNTPAGGFTYSITGPSTINGSNQTSYPVTPGATWTLGNVAQGQNVVFQGFLSPDGPPPSQAQTCATAGSSITFTLNFTDNPPASPTGLIVQNTALNSSVACGNIQITWNSSSHATDYKLYRSTDSSNAYAGGNPWVDMNSTATTYTYTPPVTDPSYYYWVAASNAGGTSALAGPSPAISPTLCLADFTNSNKIITAINGTAYPYNTPIGCIGNASGSIPKDFKSGDTIAWSVNVCNVGTKGATNIVLTDNLTDLTPVAGTYQINGSSVSPASSSGNCALGSCTLTFNIASVPVNSNAILTFNAVVTTPTGATQQLNRFRNQAQFYFTVPPYGSSDPNYNGGSQQTFCKSTGEDSAHQCVLPDPGPIVFFNGAKSPTQQEINP